MPNAPVSSSGEPSNEQQQEPEPELPIDIDYSKFLSWLIDRRHVPRNWHARLKKARRYARTAFEQSDNPAELSRNLPEKLDAHEILTYYTVKEAAKNDMNNHTERDMLGRRKKGPWEVAALAYERDGIHLADLALQIVRLTDIEMRALRNQLSNLSAEALDLARKESSIVKSVTESEKRLDIECRRYDIDVMKENVQSPAQFKERIQSFINLQVPVVLKSAVRIAHLLIPAVDYYQNFSYFVASQRELATEICERCETLRKIIEQDPSEVVKPKRLDEEEHVASTTEEIDWGIKLDGHAQGSSENSTGGIDWGVQVGESGTVIDTDRESSANDQIDWGIEVQAESLNEEPQKTSEELSDDKYTDGMTLADNETREEFLDDIWELESFLQTRHEEMRQLRIETNGMRMEVLSQVQKSMGEHIRDVSEKEIEEMIQLVTELKNVLCGSEATHLLSLQKTNERMLSKTVKSFSQRTYAKNQAMQNVKSIQRRRLVVGEQLSRVSDELQHVATTSKQVVEVAQRMVSKLHGGRDVQILGEVRRCYTLSESGTSAS